MSITQEEVKKRSCIPHEDFIQCRVHSKAAAIHKETTKGISLADTIYQFTDLIPIYVTDDVIEFTGDESNVAEMIKVISLCVNNVPEVQVNSGTKYVDGCDNRINFTVFLFPTEDSVIHLERILDSHLTSI